MSKQMKRFSASVDVSTFEVLNPEFTKAKAFIMYADENRNGSSMSRDVIDNALKTIYNIPVVGEFYEKEDKENSDFNGHGGKWIIDDNGIKYQRTTSPYGVIPSDTNLAWEFKVDEDGVEREYLTTDIILWSGRYEELETVFSNENNQSMEIAVNDGSFNESDVYEINDFNFSALCILGKDVEPCFEGAKIEVYSKNDDSEFEEMISKYKEFSMSKSEEEVVALEETFEEEVIVVEETIEEVITEDFEEEVITITEEQILGEVAEITTDETTFEITYRDRHDLLSKAVNKSESDWAWVRDFTDSYVIYEIEAWKDDEYSYNNFKVGYEIVEEEIVLAEDKVEVFQTWVTKEEKDALDASRVEMQANFDALSEELETLKTEYTKLESALEDYQTIERESLEDALFEAFDDIMKDSIEYKVLKEDKDKFAIEDLEKQIRILHSEMSMPKYNKKKSYNLTNIKITKEQETMTENPYKGVKFN